MSRKRIDALTKRKAELKELLDEYDDGVSERGSDLDAAEQKLYDAADEELRSVTETLGTLIERERRLEESDKLTSELGTVITVDRTQTDDGELYRSADGEHSVLGDMLARDVAQNPEAAGRLQRYVRVTHERATTTGDLGGIVVPQYAVDDYAPLIRERRPFADSLSSRRLTALTTIIGKQTDGTDIDTQASNGSETGAYATDDIESTAVTVTAKHLAGVAEVSVMGLDFSALDERGVFEDMFSMYATRLDYRLWHGSGNNGQHLGVLNTPNIGALDGSSVNSYEEYWAAIAQAKGEVRRNVKAPATHIAMSSMRWAMLEGATDPHGRPLLGWTFSSAQNVGGSGSEPERVPTFAGLLLVVDDNIIEDADEEKDTLLAVYRAPELRLYEQNGGAPMTMRVDQAKADEGIVQFIARGYSAFTAERYPKAVQVVSSLPTPDVPLAALDPDSSS